VQRKSHLQRTQKWSPDEHQSLDPVNQIESKVAARYDYFKKLLEAPLELPKSTQRSLEIFVPEKRKAPTHTGDNLLEYKRV